jgi:hypothetical protein
MKAKSSDVASDIPDVYLRRDLPTQNGREPLKLIAMDTLIAKTKS